MYPGGLCMLALIGTSDDQMSGRLPVSGEDVIMFYWRPGLVMWFLVLVALMGLCGHPGTR
ncbi:predicted protein [Streptomyces iranensis]|uniref:Uncharacterized protein n=2 Tax=Streptomyces iranensis TaxID=576784 RepID=A0A061A127_9ACTN|nr:predicted protein [Streptomyces iranensis]